ncbi:hypothetical protein PPERSA_07719 [Pseudocohnilembus persalinus]|uniref:Uncharacterized protein n=1 Tax=Pseudocohnilembus persalinus TaxID=266149 RepID=A0A0V0RAB0_PSEPJ|nr:hypothetical protein PPERSA_07719 [Pseudocohnilembus persalinus]|eukprot:KRX11194.1 hypothetical protein PPERSA_07719 [Pseudocohnilembus persalinus]
MSENKDYLESSFLLDINFDTAPTQDTKDEIKDKEIEYIQQKQQKQKEGKQQNFKAKNESQYELTELTFQKSNFNDVQKNSKNQNLYYDKEQKYKIDTQIIERYEKINDDQEKE